MRTNELYHEKGKIRKALLVLLAVIMLAQIANVASHWSALTADSLSRELQAAGFKGNIHPQRILEYDSVKEGHDCDCLKAYYLPDADIQLLSQFAQSHGCNRCPLPDSLLGSWVCDVTFHEKMIDMISVTTGFWFTDEGKHLFKKLYIIDTENNIVYLRYCNFKPEFPTEL